MAALRLAPGRRPVPRLRIAASKAETARPIRRTTRMRRDGPSHGRTAPAPHGATCAALLPHVMAVNVQALKAREPDNPACQRYVEIARMLTDDPTASAEDGVAWVSNLCQTLNVAPLSTYGLTEDAFPTLLEKATRASSMKGNPIRLTEDELTQILHAAL